MTHASRRAPLLLFALVLLVAGCVEVTDCRRCDDGNPCTIDDCGTDPEQPCVHWPQDGPQPGCDQQLPGCATHVCREGVCATANRSDCCGNGRCEATEGVHACPVDCTPRCDDLIQNQGEEGVDCDGPCNASCPTCNDSQKNQGERGVDCGGPCQTPCRQNLSAYFADLNALHNTYTAVTADFSAAISRFNAGGSRTGLSSAAHKAATNLAGLKKDITAIQTPDDHGPLTQQLLATVDAHLAAAHAMEDYAKTRRDPLRKAANRHLDEAAASEKRFVDAYNEAVETANAIARHCSDGVKNQYEDAIDCGGPCLEPCQRELIVSKVVVVENEGSSPLDAVLNVTPAAIDYPPFQDVLDTSYLPHPDTIVRDVEDNVFYQYTLSLAPGQAVELRITQRLRLYRGQRVRPDMEPSFLQHYLGRRSPHPSSVCEQARLLAVPHASIHETADRFFTWIHENIQYTPNREERGAAYAYRTRQGACDEHADLFVAFARCTGIPARRVTGYLENESALTGHAWSEYYDEETRSWYYLEPTVRGSVIAHRASDARHIASCVGKRAYRCGTSYAYTYLPKPGETPRLSVREDVYLASAGI